MKITCFLPKEVKSVKERAVGLDFGIKDTITDSNGNKYNFQFPESKRVKEISRKFSKHKVESKKRRALRRDLQKAYEKQSNQKSDAKNKIVSKLIHENDYVVIQNENIKAWHHSKLKGHGRRVQHSIMGGITSGLKKHPETLVIDRFFPSTQLCPKCGSLNKHGLEKRVYECACGYSCDRDTHAARNILNKGLTQLTLGTEHIKSSLDEKKTSGIKASIASEYLLTPEAHGFIRG